MDKNSTTETVPPALSSSVRALTASALPVCCLPLPVRWEVHAGDGVELGAGALGSDALGPRLSSVLQRELHGGPAVQASVLTPTQKAGGWRSLHSSQPGLKETLS